MSKRLLHIVLHCFFLCFLLLHNWFLLHLLNFQDATTISGNVLEDVYQYPQHLSIKKLPILFIHNIDYFFTEVSYLLLFKLFLFFHLYLPDIHHLYCPALFPITRHTSHTCAMQFTVQSAGELSSTKCTWQFKLCPSSMYL